MIKQVSLILTLSLSIAFSEDSPPSEISFMGKSGSSPALNGGESKGSRNPFSEPQKGTLSHIPDSLDGSGEVVFGFNKNIRWEYLPRIQVTGVMSVRGKQVACANIEGLGHTIIRAGDRVIIPSSGASSEKKKSDWFKVTSIEKDRMTIQLDDGSVVSGCLF